MSISKRRIGVITGSFGAVGALAVLSLGGTSALFTSELGPQENTLVAGTVELAEGSNSIQLVNRMIMPGDGTDPLDSTNPKARYSFVYSGEDAFVGMDIAVKSTAQNACADLPTTGAVSLADMQTYCDGTGEQPMYNGDSASGSLDLSVVPNNGSTAAPLISASTLESATTCVADVNKKITCQAEKENVLVPRGYLNNQPDAFKYTNGATSFIYVNPSLALMAPDEFQGSTVQIDLKVEAVQFKNNNAAGQIATGVSMPTGYGIGTDYLLPKFWL